MRCTGAVILASVLLVACVPANRVSGPVPKNSPVVPAADVLDVTCTSDSATSSRSVVAAHTDGVRVRYSHPPTPDDGASRWSIAWQSSMGGGGFGGDPDGTTEVVLPLAPGRVSEVACSPPIGPDGSGDPGAARWRVRPDVVDRGGVWRPSDLDCEQTASTSAGDPAGAPRDDAARIARDALLAYFGDDVAENEIEQLGYPDAPGPTYGVVREGRVLARLRLDVAEPGSDTVFPNGLEHCELVEWGRGRGPDCPPHPDQNDDRGD